MQKRAKSVPVYDAEGINYDEIPELTDFSQPLGNPYYEMLKFADARSSSS